MAKRITILEEPPLSPGTALALGLVVPGAGQFYTGRTVRGALTLIGTGAAVALWHERADHEPVRAADGH